MQVAFNCPSQSETQHHRSSSPYYKQLGFQKFVGALCVTWYALCYSTVSTYKDQILNFRMEVGESRRGIFAGLSYENLIQVPQAYYISNTLQYQPWSGIPSPSLLLSPWEESCKLCTHISGMTNIQGWRYSKSQFDFITWFAEIAQILRISHGFIKKRITVCLTIQLLLFLPTFQLLLLFQLSAICQKWAYGIPQTPSQCT